MVKTKRLAICSLLLSIALILHFVENLLPPIFILPGIKIGLANIITLIAFIFMSKQEAFAITFLRIIIGNIMGGTIASLIYSISGGTAAFIILLLFSPIFKKNYWSLSILAAIFHNLAQVFAAYLITNTVYVLWYAFPLTALGMICGIFTGISATYLSKHKIFKKFA